MRRTLVAATVAAVAAAGATALPADSATSVSVRDNVFSPKSKTVSRNTTVTFRWRGSNPHNVTITGPVRKKSRTQSSGTYRFKATKKGTYRVVCTLHAGMTMTLKAR